MKIYYGHAATQERPNYVTVRPEPGNKTALTHHVRHSLDGYGWGYGGSGPADLARSILLDSFGQEQCPDGPGECQCKSLWVEPTYQAFKGDVIANLSQNEDFKLSQASVMDWVFDYLQAPMEEENPVTPTVKKRKAKASR